MKAILVGVKLDEVLLKDFEDEMDELKNLSSACDIETIEMVKQTLPFINSQTYVGKGKLEELKMLINGLEPDVIICNDELTPLQIANISEELDILIYDRTYLILEIFKSRAKTKEAIIQVEIAMLNYVLPRLVGLRKGLSRQRGSGGGFAHGKGAGESKLELDRRINKDKISALKEKLRELSKVRKTQREKRKKSATPTVCLVGYTNSGKSTLMNKLLSISKVSEEKKVFQKNMLFATLETSSRKMSFKSGSFVLTDTVGFIEKLPHHLVEAFKSTLEEIKEADLILHVVDGSNEKYLNQIQATNTVLEKLEVKEIPVVYVFNKIDKVDNYLYIPNEFQLAYRISAKKGTNVEYLIDEINKILYKNYLEVILEIPYDKNEIVHEIYNVAINVNIKYGDDKTIIKCKMDNININKYKQYINYE